MGVIRDFSTLFEAYDPCIEDAFDNDNEDVEVVPPCRRAKKMKHRNPAKPESTSSPLPCKSKGGKKFRRFENANYLMSLDDGNDLQELTINDFISDSVSAFAQLMMMREENMEVWNDFINCSEEEQWQYMQAMDQEHNEDSETDNPVGDGRSVHPAFAADWRFGRIDGDLRSVLRKRHLPLGTLEELENDIYNFFQANPHSVRYYHLPDSFKRLMVHAVCQYMDLTSNSYNQKGERLTKVSNRRPNFHPPEILLTAYLEQKAWLRKL